jgi:hypothetical protein
MRHIIIGIVIGIVLLVCGGCTSVKTDSFEYNSPFETFAKIFKPDEHLGPVTGRYGRATFLAKRGDTDRLNTLLKQDRQRHWFEGEREGWSSFRGTPARADDNLVYFYKGQLYCIPQKGSMGYQEYLRRVKK